MPGHDPKNETTRKVSRRWPLVSGSVALALAVLIGGLVTLRGALPPELDGEWMEELLDERSDPLTAVMWVISWAGGGWFAIFVVPLGIAGALLLLRRPWSAGFAIVASALSAGVVQALKHLFGRARPEDMLVVSDFGSFPSGHTANAATVGAIAFVLTWRWWVMAAGLAWVVLMAVSRTYLGAHWLTDTIGGALIGVAVVVLLWAPLATVLHREYDKPMPWLRDRVTEHAGAR